MRTFILCAAFIIAACISVHAQTVDVQCPVDKVCISREAGLKALADDATVKAQKLEIDALNKAIADYKDLLEKARIEFATVSGANSELRQNAVSDRAIMTILLQNAKKKCMPLSVCF